MDCIFCKIVNGKINARKIHETSKSLAFLDAFPLTIGHTLVIPKNHYAKIQDMSEHDNQDLFDLVRIMTKKIESISESSLIAIHNGKESGQEVPHVHIHIIPRSSLDNAGSIHNLFPQRPSPNEKEFEKIQETIRNK